MSNKKQNETAIPTWHRAEPTSPSAAHGGRNWQPGARAYRHRRHNLHQERGPFDIIGDVHGCIEELRELLQLLGYEREAGIFAFGPGEIVRHPSGRKVIFLGDLIDRGPASAEVLRLVMSMVETDAALCVPGNHDMKLLRKLEGHRVPLRHGLARTLAELEREPARFREAVRTFLRRLVTHYVLDEGRLVVAHGGLRERFHGKSSPMERSFALFGDTTGETDEYGLPVRKNWALEYRGKPQVVYGHSPVSEPKWVNGTINIDTGCVFGGRLTALRYPEGELVSIPANREYARRRKPFA